MSLAAVEDWLVAEVARKCGGAFRSVESGPGEWSEDYLKRMIRTVPAARVAFLEGESREFGQELVLGTRWVVYLLAGWNGQAESKRRRGAGGTYAALDVLAPHLHGLTATASNDYGVAPGTRIRVTDLQNLWSGPLDRQGLALAAIGLAIPMQLDPDLDGSALSEFRRAHVDWDLDADGAVDVRQTIEIPQEDS